MASQIQQAVAPSELPKSKEMSRQGHRSPNLGSYENGFRRLPLFAVSRRQIKIPRTIAAHSPLLFLVVPEQANVKYSGTRTPKVFPKAVTFSNEGKIVLSMPIIIRFETTPDVPQQ